MVGGALGGVSVQLSVATNQANEMIENAKNEELKLKDKFNSFKNDLNEQGENIASQALNEENIEWWTIMERQAANTTGQQIQTMNEEQLRQNEKLMSEYLPDIEDELTTFLVIRKSHQ